MILKETFIHAVERMCIDGTGLIARFRRRAYVKQKGSDTIEETWTYGIQSVATPVNHHRTFPIFWPS